MMVKWNGVLVGHAERAVALLLVLLFAFLLQSSLSHSSCFPGDSNCISSELRGGRTSILSRSGNLDREFSEGLSSFSNSTTHPLGIPEPNMDTATNGDPESKHQRPKATDNSQNLKDFGHGPGSNGSSARTPESVPIEATRPEGHGPEILRPMGGTQAEALTESSAVRNLSSFSSEVQVHSDTSNDRLESQLDGGADSSREDPSNRNSSRSTDLVDSGLGSSGDQAPESHGAESNINEQAHSGASEAASEASTLVVATDGGTPVRALSRTPTGSWIHDESRPLYDGGSCGWLSLKWDCRKLQEQKRRGHGRSFAFEKYRWQANSGQKQFDARAFLARLSHRTLGFVGDSLGDQQFQSLLCMLAPSGPSSRSVSDVSSDFGFVPRHGQSRPSGTAISFSPTNTTILFLRSDFLSSVESVKGGKRVMRLDRPTPQLVRIFPRLDVLVLNTGHHWNLLSLKVAHVSSFQDGPKTLFPTQSPGTRPDTVQQELLAIGVSNVLRWIGSRMARIKGRRKPLVTFRSYSPRHFVGGNATFMGTCGRFKAPLSSQLASRFLSPLPNLRSALQRYSSFLHYFDIDFMSALRADAHVVDIATGLGGGLATQDCSHWCLPGVPDDWNAELVAYVMEKLV